MLSIIADMIMTASRQNPTGWPRYDQRFEDRFPSDPYRAEQQRRRRHNPYSYFQ